MILILEIVCNILPVSSANLYVVDHLGSRACLIYTYIFNRHRVFRVLFMCHVIVWYKIIYYNAYSNTGNHVVFVWTTKWQWREMDFII